MKGLELARSFWEECGAPRLREELPELSARCAAGLAGNGSDCLGYDDEVSRDHDWGAGFLLWLPAADAETDGFRLSAFYDHLPDRWQGFPVERRSRMGDGRFGVRTIESFYRTFTGTGGAPENWRQWLALPSFYLAAAVSGAVFFDGPGEFTRIREELRTGMPEDVRLKKIAARAALMAQSGQYNFARCLRHGERGAARLAADEFVRETAAMAFLLNRRHMPYYKWALRALGELPVLGSLAPRLEALLAEPREAEIEDICGLVVRELRRQDLTDGDWDYLEPHAREVMERIRDPEIAALHVMEG